MAVSNLLAASFLAALLLLLGARADDPDILQPSTASPPAANDDSSSLLKAEVEQLRSKISFLETSVAERVRELKSREENVARLEKLIEEKSASVAALQDEIKSVQKKGSVDVNHLVGEADARADNLEKQVEKLKSEIEAQNTKRDGLESRANEAEKKLQELSAKLKNLQKTNDEQKQRIQKTERALKVAEEELMRAQLEATSKTRELIQVHGAWLPSWLVTHVNYCQDLTAIHWNEHAKPILNSFLKKASEKWTLTQQLVEPHLETAKTKWVPAVKEQWLVLVTSVEPHVQLVSTKTIEFYETSKISIEPHIAKVQQLADPYIQELRKFSKPYVDQVALVTKPHVETIRVVLKPYTTHAVRAYQKFLVSATEYHHQVQAAVMETLKKYELTEPLATKKLVWFMASALLAFPVFSLYRLLSTIFCKKTRKPKPNARTSHASRRHKRRHTDK